MSIQPEEWLDSGKFIPFDGLRLFTRKQGRGRPVLCLHAFPTGSYDYSRIAPLLTDQYELIFLDYPGFGFSEKPRQYAYSLFKYADAVETVCKNFKLDSVWLLAHDIGDSIALELLRRGTPAVEKLVLLNGSVFSIPFADPWMALSQKVWLNPVSGSLVSRLRLFRKFLFARMFRQIFARPLPRDEIQAFWSLLCYNDGLGIYHRLMGYMPERWEYQHQWLDALAKHTAPVTLIWGQADPVATPAVAEYVLARRPDAHYVRLEGVGHYPHWEVPSLVADAVLDAFARDA
jgi:pimeloyl-ACP methyl ester carboxylesterase